MLHAVLASLKLSQSWLLLNSVWYAQGQREARRLLAAFGLSEQAQALSTLNTS